MTINPIGVLTNKLGWFGNVSAHSFHGWSNNAVAASARIKEAIWPALSYERCGSPSVSNGMNAPTRNGINVPKWMRLSTT